jgi:hypothetical protein
MTQAATRLSAPESYVVRIYRRDARLPSRVAGTVEVVESGSELSFTSLGQLQRILAQQGVRPSATAKR